MSLSLRGSSAITLAHQENCKVFFGTAKSPRKMSTEAGNTPIGHP